MKYCSHILSLHSLRSFGESINVFSFIASIAKARFVVLLLAAYMVASCEDPVVYMVTFDSTEGSPVALQNVNDGSLANKPDEPTRAEFTFVGWYKDKDLMQIFNFDTDRITSSITLYAGWTPGPYNVTFDSKGGTAVEPQRVAADGLVNLLDAPKRENFAFLGWYTEETFDFATRFSLDKSPTMDLTLYAKWADANNYTFNNGKLTSIANATAAFIEIPDNVNGEVVKELLGTATDGIFGQNFNNNNTTVVTLVIPPSVTIIGESALNSCISLVDVTLPNALTSIRKNAFYNCTALKALKLPLSVLSIGESVFYNCLSLNDIELPGTMSSVGANAFYNCRSLRAIVWPGSAASIRNSTFLGCILLTDVDIPNEVESIGSNAFFNCKSITTIVLPSMVTRIGNAAFGSCAGLANIKLEAVMPPITTVNLFEGTSNTLAIMVPSASEAAYESAEGWRNYANRISGY